MNRLHSIQRAALSALLCLMSVAFAMAQVNVDAKIDSVAIFIGEQAHIQLKVTADKGTVLELPEYDSLKHITPGIEVLSSTVPDTQWINDNKRFTLSKNYTITSFDTTLYRIPPMKVKAGDKIYESKSMALKVLTFEVDTLHPEQIAGMKTVMTPPFDWNEWKGVVMGALAVVILTMLLLYVAARLNDNKPIIKRIKLKPHIAPHKAAMQKIEQIREEKMWQNEDSKEYYTRLTDTLRQYINERYGFNAMEMTSGEIIERLQQIDDPMAIDELNELFTTADLVKFAKYNTLINENDRNLVTAIEFINTTKKEEKEQQQPTEIVVVEKRSSIIKRVLVISIIVAALALTCVAGYITYRIVLLNI
ncbi:MAG: hypothetical protein IKH26_07430 [Bacteroidaceae bacterium]|nr:hypothetical protein [Bacteroidaceae bacterium]